MGKDRAGGETESESNQFKSGFAEGWRAAITELATSHAVNHPVRLDCFAILLGRDASAKEIAHELKEPIRTVSYHLNQLHNSGVIRCVDTEQGGKRRGASEYFYRAVNSAEVVDGEWAALPQSARREIAGRALRAVIALGLSSLRCEEMEKDPLLRLIWVEVPVDAEGEVELADFLEEANERIKVLKALNKERLEVSGEKGVARVISLLGFRRADPGNWTRSKAK